MTNNINLAETQPVNTSETYLYHITLEEFNGQCRIIYNTNSPLLCSGTINLVTTNGPAFVKWTDVNATGGHFDTEEPWGTGWYAQWNVLDANNIYKVIASTPATT